MNQKTDQNSKSKTQNPNAFENMDRMYRIQRHFYDLTRKYYLLGRDRLLKDLDVRENEFILEAGCGTGRNLAILARENQNARFFGLDASAAMLETAQKKTAHFTNVQLRVALADDFDFKTSFGLAEPFDKIFFSYSISMIPTWQKTVRNALENLKPGKSLYFVDFYDQSELPGPFRKLLQTWLRQFHVKYPDELIPYLKRLETEGAGSLSVKSIYRSYAFIAVFNKKR